MNKEKEEIKFAKGKCFYKLFWIFLIGSFFGCIWEELLDVTVNLLSTQQFIFKYERGLVIGPFSPVYGFGAMLITLIFCDRNLKWWQYILYGSLIGGGFEYFLSYTQELLTGTVSWNYYNIPFNINGRTNIFYMFFWGLLAYIWATSIYPKISNKIENWNYNIANFITIILIIFMSFDILLSWSASLRQANRKKGLEPNNKIEEYYDKKYNDEFFNKYYEVIDK